MVLSELSENITTSLIRRLKLHKDNNLYRKRSVIDNNLIDFSSNDYLGLASDKRLLNSILDDEIKSYGSGASSYVNGYSLEHKSCEDAFARAFGFDGALLFGSGFMANMGVMKALVDKNTLVFQDKLNHASLIDGALASDGRLIRYNHLDLGILKNKIKKYKAQYNTKSGLIASDIVFSMDGDVADINNILKIGKDNNYPVIFDEAHSLGVLGKLGLGLVADFKKVDKENIILICPLGKAFGAYGAIVLANGTYLEAIEQFARTLIYSTSLPPLCAKIAEKSLGIILSDNNKMQYKLAENIKYFQAKALSYNLPVLVNNNSAVQGVLIGDSQKALALSEYLKQTGFFACAMRSPTVPLGSERIRLTIRSAHDFLQIDSLLSTIHDYFVLNSLI